MKKIFLILLFIFSNNVVQGAVKEKIILNLDNTYNLTFKFEQNINGKIENGNCIIEYPKKIRCEYNKSNDKILVSNGKSLVIKTKSGSYYRYTIKSTPLNYILDKNFLINEIINSKERIIDKKFINFTILKDKNEINVFFDTKSFDLIGWQTLDIYQNLNITYLFSIQKNQILEENIFKLPASN
tara:strand:- start:658 stop:1209 length:552 start_codon:yes stop_codon:yes gene_type:complete